MVFFDKFKFVTPQIINQLWQSDYINSDARNAAYKIIAPPLNIKIWVERLLMVFGMLFLLASILLFFAYNWAHIPPMIKLGAILTFIAILACLNFYLMQRGKVFYANLVLISEAFLVGIFMAVYGQIYQTGADSYTLFITWAIMILPWVVMSRFTPLWVLWIIVVMTALVTWWDLRIYPRSLENDDLVIAFVLFYLCLYIGAEIAIKLKQKWLDKKWVKIFLAVGIFAPITYYLLDLITDAKPDRVDLRVMGMLVVFSAVYIYVKWIKRSLAEYSVAFFSAVIILGYLVVKAIFDITESIDDAYILTFLIEAGFIVLLLKYAYQYFKFATQNFEENYS